MPNPASTSPTHLAMYQFLGKLFGIAIRNKEYLPLSLPALFWKVLVRETATLEDLILIDRVGTKGLDDIAHIERKGVTEDLFEDIVDERFVVVCIDGQTRPLCSGGASKEVTWDNRQEYVDLMKDFRLHEIDLQVTAIRSGLATIVPHRLLPLFNGAEFEKLVCGVPEVDIDLLMEMTDYGCGISERDRHVVWFWNVMRDFSMEERSLLLKFVWGRARLPLTRDGFSSKFKLQPFSRSPADSYLPVAHTCFFSLEVPAYSSEAIMRKKLLYAIHNCTAIDADDTSVATSAAAMGWD
jgi:hypothetical protein